MSQPVLVNVGTNRMLQIIQESIYISSGLSIQSLFIYIWVLSLLIIPN